MPEMHLRQPEFTYSTFRPIAKTKKEYKNLKKLEIDDIFIKTLSALLACLQHDIVYGYFKDLARRTASHKILRDEAFNITKNPKHDGYQRGLPSLVYKFFDKKNYGGSIENANMSGQQLAEELHKSIIRKFKNRKMPSPFIENIWVADLTDM